MSVPVPARRAPVLIADDDRDTRETLRDLLELEGYPVITARNGAEALERMRLEGPGLVLLDLVMPAMDGVQVCRLRAADPALAAIPVAVISASVGQEERLRPLNLAAYLEKPVRIDTLLELVRQFCG